VTTGERTLATFSSNHNSTTIVNQNQKPAVSDLAIQKSESDTNADWSKKLNSKKMGKKSLSHFRTKRFRSIEITTVTMSYRTSSGDI